MTAAVHTQGYPVDQNISVSTGPLIALIMGAAISFVGVLIRIAIKETLQGLKSALEAHAASIRDLSVEVKHMREEFSIVKVEIAGTKLRLDHVEDQIAEDRAQELKDRRR